MDSNTLVIGRIEQGARAVEAISAAGLPIHMAYWGRLVDGDRWQLYMAAPEVDQNGSRDAYKLVGEILRTRPQLGLELSDIRLMGLRDSLSTGALEKWRTRHPLANPNPIQSMTSVYDCSIAGYDFEELEIYPPRQPLPSP